MKSILEILNLSSDFLKKKGIQNPRRQAEEILSDALNIDRLQLYIEFERPLSEIELELCRQRLARRGQGEPAPYIRGLVDFYDCQIKVNRAVLIPRQETELLVDKIVKELANQSLNGKVLWDLCCGSGCIGIALKKRFPELTVILADLSSAALEVARENAQLNGVSVQFLHGNFLEPFAGKKTDFFVCNPPYISENEYRELDLEVKKFEPQEALVSGPTGLEFYEKLSKQLKEHLSPGAKAWMEIGYRQKDAILHLFSDQSWRRCDVSQDLAGHDRFFFLENE